MASAKLAIGEVVEVVARSLKCRLGLTLLDGPKCGSWIIQHQTSIIFLMLVVALIDIHILVDVICACIHPALVLPIWDTEFEGRCREDVWVLHGHLQSCLKAFDNTLVPAEA